MIRRKIEGLIGPVSDAIFSEAAEEATRDLRVERLAASKKTDISYTGLVMVAHIKTVQDKGLEKEKSPKLIA